MAGRAGFEAGPANPTPMTIGIDRALDLTAVLPPGGKDRLQKFRLYVADLRAVVPDFSERQELATHKIACQQRLDKLTGHPHNSGHGLALDDVRVVAAEKELASAVEAHRAIEERYQQRSAAYQAAGQTLAGIERWLRDWVDRSSNAVLEDYDGPPAPLPKNGDLLGALARALQANDELADAFKRIQASCWPSDHAKQKMRAAVEQLAQRAGESIATSITSMIKFDSDMQWPLERVRVDVLNTEKPAVGFCQVPDLALFAWVDQQALIKRLDAEIDRMADDQNALGAG